MGVWNGINDGNGAIVVASDAETTMATITVPDGASKLWVEVNLSDITSLTTFNTKIKIHPSGSFFTLANTSDDYTDSIEQPIRAASTDFTNLLSDTSGFLWMEVRALNQVRFTGQAVSSDGVLATVYWSMR